jgi:hypothetical protein
MRLRRVGWLCQRPSATRAWQRLADVVVTWADNLTCARGALCQPVFGFGRGVQPGKLADKVVPASNVGGVCWTDWTDSGLRAQRLQQSGVNIVNTCPHLLDDVGRPGLRQRDACHTRRSDYHLARRRSPLSRKGLRTGCCWSGDFIGWVGMARIHEQPGEIRLANRWRLIRLDEGPYQRPSTSKSGMGAWFKAG